MKKSKAKQSIVETAQKMIEKKGYFNLNINEVAYIAKVSVGTLYYHFPKGKADILAEIMSHKVEGFVEEFNKELGVEKILEKSMNLEETLRWFFKKIIELRRTDRYFLTAIQSEMLADPDEYMKFVKKYQNTDGLQQAMGILSEVVMKAGKTRTDSLNKVVEKRETILRVVGLLMNYQIIFPSYFGEDDEFVNLALRIFFEILN
ncbi:MAG: TetR/AcrR family transcriptional regulator [Asgard group archaeon]|nr:TetR/AcrR family transcriptional regulator [Asgard group archaeon]